MVIKKILRRQLAAVDIEELRKSNSLEKLAELSRESFKAHWRGKDLEAIKSLDRITRELQIPSRSGCNNANCLTVYILLFFDNIYYYNPIK